MLFLGCEVLDYYTVRGPPPKKNYLVVGTAIVGVCEIIIKRERKKGRKKEKEVVTLFRKKNAFFPKFNSKYSMSFNESESKIFV